MAETIRRRWAPILGALLLVACAARAEAASARLRWVPNNDPRVTGYRVYSRQAGHPYGSFIDAGRPTPQADGNIAYTVNNLGAGTYYFAVVTYGAGSLLSPLSAELPLGTPSPCLIDHCASTTSCDIRAASDGSSCDDGVYCDGIAVCQGGNCVNGPPPDCDDGIACTDDSCDESLARCVHTSHPNCCETSADCVDSDACTTGERCLGGSCVSEPEVCPASSCTSAFCDAEAGCGLMPVADGVTCEACGVLRPRKIVIGLTGGTGKITLKASFDNDVIVDPSTFGLLLDIATPNGTVLYSGNVPHDFFMEKKNGTKFRFLASHDAEGLTNGITGALLRLRGEAWELTLRGKSADLMDAVGRDQIAVTLSFGFLCMSDANVGCEGQSARAICR